MAGLSPPNANIITAMEIDGEIADDLNRSVIQEQVEMGVAVRMAAMDILMRNRRQAATEAKP